MIKGIILDVDGVIIGDTFGLNAPNPHLEVIKTLKNVRKSGIPIILCSGKASFGIAETIKLCELDNFHVADGGGVIFNPIQNKIHEVNEIPFELSSQIVELFLQNNFYIEIYSTTDYFIQENQLCEITEKHTKIMQDKSPVQVKNLVEVLKTEKIVKIMPVLRNDKEKERLVELFKKFDEKMNLKFALHPSAGKYYFGIITPLGVSKLDAIREVMELENFSFEEALGVGDAMVDWGFIEFCKFGAAMGNGEVELKEKVKSKGQFGFIGPNVQENGIIEVFKNFGAVK